MVVKSSKERGTAVVSSCRISEILSDEILADVLETEEADTELQNEITLYMGLPKGDKMELIIQKAVELGVSRIVPVSMKRSIVKLDAKKAKARTARCSWPFRTSRPTPRPLP